MTALTFGVNPLKAEADTLPARARNSSRSWESHRPATWFCLFCQGNKYHMERDVGVYIRRCAEALQ